MHIVRKNFFIIIFVAVFVFAFSALLVKADFNSPTASPPGNNVSAPIYSEGSSQDLSGGLNVKIGRASCRERV